MRNDLNGLAKVFAFSFFAKDVPIDLTGREVGVLIKILIDESLVVAKVEIGFRTVIGDEDLTMLEWGHGAWVDIDIWVKLLGDDLETALLEQTAKRCSGDAFS